MLRLPGRHETIRYNQITKQKNWRLHNQGVSGAQEPGSAVSYPLVPGGQIVLLADDRRATPAVGLFT